MPSALQKQRPLRSYEDVASVTFSVECNRRDAFYATIVNDLTDSGLKEDLEAAGVTTEVRAITNASAHFRSRKSRFKGEVPVWVEVTLRDGRQGMCEEDDYPSWEDAIEQMPCFPPLQF